MTLASCPDMRLETSSRDYRMQAIICTHAGARTPYCLLAWHFRICPREKELGA